MRRLFLLVVLLPALLSGCAYFFAAPEPPPPPPPPEPARDLIKEIREAAQSDVSVLEVLAIEPPSITHLIEQALEAEARGKFLEARRAVAVAREIEPTHPKVMQFLAEYALRSKDYTEAENLAFAAFQNSSQLGELCIRNQLTLAETRLRRDDPLGAEGARITAESCARKPLPRF